MRLAAPKTGAGRDDLIHRKVQCSVETFGSSLLTAREREVLFHMLRGFSSAMTAERLATTEGTIKIHRKNIHRKLDISSQAELFSLFIDCIPFADPGHRGRSPGGLPAAAVRTAAGGSRPR